MFNYLRTCHHSRWDIGFFNLAEFNLSSNKFPEINWIKGVNKECWYADPFILSFDSNRIILLAEEMTYKIGRGRIARLEIDANNYMLLSSDIILDIDTHVSFPFILRHNSEVFIIPENTQGNSLKLYRYRETEPMEYMLDITNFPIADAIIHKTSDEKYVLIGTTLPDYNGKLLSVYEFDIENLKASTLLNKIAFKNREARNGGDILSHSNQEYRVAQNCNGHYGNGLIIQRYIKSEDKYVNVASLNHVDFRNNMGVHTLNCYNGLCVIDAHGYRSPILGRIISKLLGRG